MKGGSGADDPFADDEFEDDDQDDPLDDLEPVDHEPDDTPDEERGSSSDNGDDGLPRILERRTVKGQRSEVIQLDVRQPTVSAEQEAHAEVNSRFDEKVYLTDFREAAYLVAMRHLDEVEEELRDWGYDYRS